MEKNEAISRALEYINRLGMGFGEVSDVRRVTVAQLLDKANECPNDLVETYKSVLKKFRDRWVVDFTIPMTGEEMNCVNCPGTKSICVYDSGEIEEASHM